MKLVYLEIIRISVFESIEAQTCIISVPFCTKAFESNKEINQRPFMVSRVTRHPVSLGEQEEKGFIDGPVGRSPAAPGRGVEPSGSRSLPLLGSRAVWSLQTIRRVCTTLPESGQFSVCRLSLSLGDGRAASRQVAPSMSLW